MHVGSENWPNGRATVAQIAEKVKAGSDRNMSKTRCIAVCCLWGCAAVDQSGCPCWPVFTAKSTYNGHASIRTGPWSNGRRQPGMMNRVFLLNHVDGRVPARCLPREEMAPGYTMERRQPRGGSVMLCLVESMPWWVRAVLTTKGGLSVLGGWS